MNTAVGKNFSVKPLVAAIALSVSAGYALATPPVSAVPGAGYVSAVNAGTTLTSGLYNSTTPAGNVKGDIIYNGVSGLVWPFLGGTSIQINNAAGNAYAVINWGGVAAAQAKETFNAFGFNIGANAVMNFTSNTVAGTRSAILNVDGSGSPSFIMGHLYAYAAGAGPAPQVYVANANGIIVGANAEIVAPAGIGLIGADMTGATSINDFVANNTATAAANAGSFITFTSGLAPVQVDGSVAGNFATQPQAPAAFALYAGSNVVHTGNTFASFIYNDAGMTRTTSKATVNATANTAVNRLWAVNDHTTGNSGFLYIDPNLAGSPSDLGTTGGLQIAASGSVVNTGSLSVDSAGFGWYLANASNGFRSGIAGSKDPSIGIFADLGVFLYSYTSGSTIEVYNSVKGFTFNKVLPFFQINTDGLDPIVGYSGDVIINALTVGSLPSSITTTGGVAIYGQNVTINSTINHKLNSAGGVNGNGWDLDINGSKSVTVNAPIGAGDSVMITAKGPILLAAGANVVSDAAGDGNGGIYITNNGTQALNSTTINSNLTTNVTSDDDISIVNNGISNSTVVITGNMTSNQEGDVEVFSRGNLSMTGTTLAADDFFTTALGSQVWINGPITANVDPQGLGNNGRFGIAAPTATIKLGPSGLITSPITLFGFDEAGWFAGPWIGVNNVQGVNAAGNRYATQAEKPAQQIVTNELTVLSFGSFNAPWGSNTNWVTNAMQVDPLVPSLPVMESWSLVGAGAQYINTATKGDVWVDSGITITPFQGTTGIGGEGWGTPIGNGGSSVINQATGSMQVMSASGAQSGWTGGPGYLGLFGNAAFSIPGGIALVAGNTLSQFLPIWNAWTVLAVPYQGVWLQAPTIYALGYYAIDGNARVNFSTPPVNGVPLVYKLIHPNAIDYAFEQVTDRAFINTYTAAIVGGPINNCPIGLVC